MPEHYSRRDALRTLAVAFGAAATLLPGHRAGAAELPHVLPTDASATALGYHEDAKTVDAKANPTYQSSQVCGNCVQLKGNEGDAWRPCNLFPGKLVNANGWCKLWTKKAPA
jgi:hypothetical protein